MIDPEFITLIITLLSGFGAVVISQRQQQRENRILAKENEERIENNKLAIEGLRRDVQLEFARCRQHQCGGLVPHFEEVKENDRN